MRSLLPVLTAAVVTIASLAPAQARELSFSTAAGPPLSTAADGTPGFLDLLLAEAFGRLGHRVRLRLLPAERALLNANEGIDDGDAYRIGGLEEIYPNLLRVAEPVLDAEFVAYSRGRAETGGEWETLKGRNVGIITGWKILEKNLAKIANLTTVRDTDQLFGILQRGRVEVAMYGKWQGLWYLKSKGLRFRMWPKSFAQMPMFVYLNKKNRDLAGPLAECLHTMKSDGSLQRIFENTLKKLEDVD